MRYQCCHQEEHLRFDNLQSVYPRYLICFFGPKIKNIDYVRVSESQGSLLLISTFNLLELNFFFAAVKQNSRITKL